MSIFDRYTIEPSKDRWELVGHGTYPESSVLAGQARRLVLYRDSLENLRRAWPRAEVLDHSTKRASGETLEEISRLPECPPAWFDPADAGENW